MGQKMTTVGSGGRGRELGKEARFGAAGKEFDVGNICQVLSRESLFSTSLNFSYS